MAGLGKEITLARIEKLLGPKVLERLQTAALREEAMSIVPITPEELVRAADWIEGKTPKAANGHNGHRPRFQDRAVFTRAASKYFREKPMSRTRFVEWCRAAARSATRVESRITPKGKTRGKG